MTIRDTWTPNTGEDRLLHRYWQARGGRDTIFTEVGVAGKRKASHWRSDSTERRLDGVRLGKPTEPGIFPKQGTTGRFAGHDGSPVELIEVKAGLSEEVIGQSLVGRLLWTKQYTNAPVERTIALCKIADPLLVWVCEQPSVDIHVEVIPNARKPGRLMTSRLRHMLDDRWVEALEPWRRDHLYFTEIPLGPTRVNLLRVGAGPDLLARYDTRDRLLDAIDGRPVELIEIRRALTRGVVGRLLAHTLLLKKEYGIDVGTKRVLVGRSDEALKWACGELGIEVELDERIKDVLMREPAAEGNAE